MVQGGICAANFAGQEVCNPVVRQREDECVSGLLSASVKDGGFERAIFEEQAADWRAQDYFPALFFDGNAAGVVKLGERNGGKAHYITGTIFKKCFPYNVESRAGAGCDHLLAASSDKKAAPE